MCLLMLHVTSIWWHCHDIGSKAAMVGVAKGPAAWPKSTLTRYYQAKLAKGAGEASALAKGFPDIAFRL
jgi:hypothetical protein